QATYVFSFPTPVTDFAMVAGGLNNDDGTYIIATLRGVPVQITAANFSNLSTGMSFRDEDGDGESDTVVSQNQDGDPGVITNTYNLSIPGPVDEIRVVTGKEDNNGGNVTLGFLSIEYCADPDYGDAPLSYDDTTGNGTLNSSDTPAQHTISSTLHLGTTRPDAEAAPQSSAAANGDDVVNTPAVDDEDGITTFPPLEQAGTSYSLTTTVNNANNVPANVYAWIDFDRDGEFDEDERAADATVAANSTNAPVTLSWSNIGSSGPNITAGASYVRVRVTTEDLDSSADTTNRDDASVGSALDGEVEDYGVTITAAAANDPNLLLVKRITRINGQTTNGSIDLDVYVNAPDYPYDDNDLDNPAPNPIDTENWPNTPNSTTSGFLRGQTNGGETQPGDEVEYTIYFLSDGSQDAEDVQFCDRIPNSQTFVPDTFNAVTPAPGGGAGANRGILVEYDGNTFSFSNDNDGDTAQFFPPGAVLPDVCSNVPNQSEDNGAVVVNLGTIPHANSPGTPTDSFGLIRFRAVIK
ncbi:MAG: GEVED domain-containing protein, partial [Cyanobacteria bacterium P01_A01_bin.17]